MNLQDILKRIVQEQGRDILQKPELLSVMEDYQAFAKEGPAAKAVMQQLVRSGGIQALTSTRRSGTSLHPEIKRLVSDTAALGFKEEIVSDILKAIVFASGKMSRETEWPKVMNPQKTPVVVQQKTKPTTLSVWKRLKKWLWTYSEDLFAITLLITTILTVVTLFLTLIALVNGTPQVGHWAKEFLICLVSTIVIFFIYAFSD